MKISIIGSGYVGLITGISLATLGHVVVCIDNDKEKVLKINSGKAPFFEPNVDDQLKKVIDQGLLHATDIQEENLVEADVIIITVGTPTADNRIDLFYIKKASEQIGNAIGKSKKYQVIVVKSTVLPGVTEEVVKTILEKHSKKKVGEFGLCMNPEFLREGSALEDALNPDRIIIGQYDEKSGREFAKVYEKVSTPKFFTNIKTAELTKYAANALFATLISFSNEIARISENTENVDVVDVWRGVHLDKRLTPLNGHVRIKPGILSYIFSGCGFGGSCFPKDIKALASFAAEVGIEPNLLKSVIEINGTQPQRVILKLKETLGDDLKGLKIAILGLTFKPGTDDMRESPSLSIVKDLLSERVVVSCHDPQAYKGMPKELIALSGIFSNSIEETIEGADAAIIITSWEEYIKLSPQFFKKYMKNPVVIDSRRIYDKDLFLKAGIIYKGIGL